MAADTQPSPCVRARATQELLDAMDDFEPGLEARVRAVVPKEALAVVDDAMATDWLPTAVTRHVIDGVFTVLGSERAPRLWRFFMVHNFARSPLLRSFIDGVLRMVGTEPRAFMTHAARAWSVSYRDFGELVAHPVDGERCVELHLSGVPVEMFRYPQYFRALAGAFEGFLDLVEVDSRCATHLDPQGRSVRWDLRW